MQCMAVDELWKGRRRLWAVCRYEREHSGPHHDRRYKGHYWLETFRAFEFDASRTKVATARKVRLCRKCKKQVRTDGANDSCVCKETGANLRQAILFAEEREKQVRLETLKALEEDIAWIEQQWSESYEYYSGEW